MSDVLAKYNSAISAYKQPLDDIKQNLLESLFTLFAGILEDKYIASFIVFLKKIKTGKRETLLAALYLQNKFFTFNTLSMA